MACLYIIVESDRNMRKTRDYSYLKPWLTLQEVKDTLAWIPTRVFLMIAAKPEPEQKKSQQSNSPPARQGQRGQPKPDDPKNALQWRMPPGRTWLIFLLILLVNYIVGQFLTPSP